MSQGSWEGTATKELHIAVNNGPKMFANLGYVNRCVDDVAIYFDALKGFDAKDSTSLSDDDVNYIKQSRQTSDITKEPREMAVGIPQEYFCEDMSDEGNCGASNDLLRTLVLNWRVRWLSKQNSFYVTVSV